VQFPVLRKYEQNTWYDQNGRIIYTKNRGLPGVGFKSTKWKEIKDRPSGTVERTVEDGHPTGWARSSARASARRRSRSAIGRPIMSGRGGCLSREVRSFLCPTTSN